MSILANAAKIVAAATKAFEVIKALIAVGKDAGPMIQVALETFKKDELTDDDLVALEGRIEALRAELHAPLPAAEPGEGE